MDKKQRLRKRAPRVRQKMSPQYEKIHEDFIKYEESRFLSENTIGYMRGGSRRLLLYLDNNKMPISSLKFSDTSTIIARLAEIYGGGLGNFLFTMRELFKYLYRNGFTEKDLSICVPKTFAPRRKLYPALTDEEVKMVFEAIDFNKPNSRRDFAIIAIALETGLRGCDIVGLKKNEINFASNTISCIQDKTLVPITTHITNKTKTAILNYIKLERPKTDSPFLFLYSEKYPVPISNSILNNRAVKYMKEAGFYKKGCCYGFHTFRRTFATNLLKNKSSISSVQELMGHRAMDSVRPYLSIDESNLKMCAIPLSTVYKGANEK